MQKIVTIGGGTGHFQVLKGLKNYECGITAIVNMSDDGGSSGRLRDEYGILPPGDARQCLIALADRKKGELRDLFNFRLKDGHSLGNYIITALTKKGENEAEGIKRAGDLLGISGKVLPVTIDRHTLIGETSNGKILRGESEINYPDDLLIKIKNIYLEPQAFLYKNSGQEIRNADKIVICPGCLYGSIIPNFLVEGFKEALKKSKAKKIFICNLFTKEGEYGFKVSDYVKEIEKYAQIKVDYILVNTKMPSEETKRKYLNQNSTMVENDLNDNRIIKGEFAGEFTLEPKTIIRHIPRKIARAIIEI